MAGQPKSSRSQQEPRRERDIQHTEGTSRHGFSQIRESDELDSELERETGIDESGEDANARGTVIGNNAVGEPTSAVGLAPWAAGRSSICPVNRK